MDCLWNLPYIILSNVLIKEFNNTYVFHISSLEIFEQTLFFILAKFYQIEDNISKNTIKISCSNKE
jgi:hypothetical protein